MKEKFSAKAKRFAQKASVTLKKIGKGIIEWSPWIITATTVTAAWSGYVTSNRNEKRLDKLEQFKEETIRVVNQNADVLRDHIEEHQKLVEDNKATLDEAMAVTEGKETA